MYAYYLAHELAALKVDTHVLTSTPGHATLYPRSHRDRVVVHAARGLDFHGLDLDGVINQGLALMRKNEYQVIHANHFGAAYVGLNLKAAFGTPLVVALQKSPPMAPDKTLAQRDSGWCSTKLLVNLQDSVDAWVANSHAYEKNLIAFGAPRKKVRVIYPGILIDRYRNPRVRRPGNLPSGPRLILCPSRLDSHKGLMTLVDAASRVKLPGRANGPLVRITGDEENKVTRDKRKLRRNLKAFARAKGVPLEIRPEPLEDMPRLYHAASVCVLPSTKEGLGIVLLEAMAAGVPVVASNVHGIQEVVKPAVNGLFFEPDDVDDLANQLTVALTKPRIRGKLVRGGLKTVMRSFDATHTARQHLKLYRELIRNSHQR